MNIDASGNKIPEPEMDGKPITSLAEEYGVGPDFNISHVGRDVMVRKSFPIRLRTGGRATNSDLGGIDSE